MKQRFTHIFTHSFTHGEAGTRLSSMGAWALPNTGWSVKHKLHKTLSLALVACSLTLSQAALASAYTPSALSMFASNKDYAAALAGKDVLIYSQKPKKLTLASADQKVSYKDASYTTSMIVVPKSASQVRALLSDYAGYVGLFPALTQAKTLSAQGQSTTVRYKVELPLPIPVLSFSEEVTFRHDLGDTTMDIVTIDSPFPYSDARFEWFELGPNKTLVTFTQFNDLDRPKGFLVSTVLKAMPEIKAAIPASSGAFVMEALRRNAFGNQAVSAKHQYGADSVPKRSLSAAQRRHVSAMALVSGKPVTFVHAPLSVAKTPSAEPLRYTSAYAVLPAAKPKAQELLSNLNNYPSLVRQVKKVSQTPTSAGQDTSIKVAVGLGVISIPFDLRLNVIQRPTGMRFFATGGDVNVMEGVLGFEPWSSTHTQVELTSTTLVTEDAPWLLRVMRKLPYAELMSAVGMPSFIFDRAKVKLES